jgi:hypothetical protein
MTIVGPPISLGELALRIAIGEVGVCESPPGSNRGPRVDEYIRAVQLNPERDAYPWCAAFVSWCMQRAVRSLRPVMANEFRSAASVALLLARNRGAIVEEPAMGDIFLHIAKSGNHCGFVSAIADNGDLATVEGNSNRAGSRTGGEVVHMTRPRSYVTAYVRPA